jgi:hypothetical protein
MIVQPFEKLRRNHPSSFQQYIEQIIAVTNRFFSVKVDRIDNNFH